MARRPSQPLFGIGEGRVFKHLLHGTSRSFGNPFAVEIFRSRFGRRLVHIGDLHPDDSAPHLHRHKPPREDLPHHLTNPDSQCRCFLKQDVKNLIQLRRSRETGQDDAGSSTFHDDRCERDIEGPTGK